MRTCTSLIILIAFLLSTQVNAHQPEEGKVTAAFGPVFSGRNLGTTTDVLSRPIIGLGLQVIGDIDVNSSLQIELEVLPKRFLLEQSDRLKLLEQVNAAQIGLGYRRWWVPHVSSSVVVSSVYPVGEPLVIDTGAAGASDLATSAHANVVYGAKIGIQYEPGDHKYNNPTFDLRYYLPFSPQRGEKSDFVGFFFGYRFPAH